MLLEMSVTALSFENSLRFMELCWQLVPYLELWRRDPSLDLNYLATTPPLDLPVNVTQFLADCIFSQHTEEDCAIIDEAWNTLSRLIWATRQKEREAVHLIDSFLQYGPQHKIGK